MSRKTAVVTGAGEGIGRAVSVKLAKEGFHVYVTDMILDKAKARWPHLAFIIRNIYFSEPVIQP